MNVPIYVLVSVCDKYFTLLSSIVLHLVSKNLKMSIII
jgi:hypothetical protein